MLTEIPVIEIKYFDKEMPKIVFIQGDKSDWFDLRSAEDRELKQGENAVIRLGIAMKLPDGYEAHIAPRSSTFKNWGVLQTNSVGVIDNSYNGDTDEWMMPVYATRDTVIHKYDRICQFRIMPKQPSVKFKEKEHLAEINRRGFGATGIN